MNLKKKINSVKFFICRNQTKILTTALVITTTTAVLMIRNKILSDEFLKEHDLYEEYYALNENE